MSAAAVATTTEPPVVHPAAAALPEVTGAEFEALVADISRRGLQQPIVRTPSGAILDGRARWYACQRLGFKPQWVVHRGNPWTYAIETNLRRRKLTYNHRAMIAATLADRAKGQSYHTVPHPDLPPTRAQAEALLSVATGALDRAKRVIRSGSEALKALTAAEEVALNTAARVAQLPIEAQDAFVAKVKAGADPRQLGRPGGAFDATPGASITQREARYKYVQEPVLRVLADSLDGLALVLASAEGLDPAITSAQAAQWCGDLGRRARSLRQLLRLLKERSK